MDSTSNYQPLNDKCRIMSSKTKGKMLIASRDIPLKSHVFTIPNPLLAVVDNAHLKEVCYECFTAKGRWDWTTRQNGTMNKKEFLVCTGCGVARYCDKGCQKISWRSFHRTECPIFASLFPRILPTAVRAAMRILWLSGSAGPPFGSQQAVQQFMALESHEDEFKKAGGQKWEDICLMSKAAKEYSGSQMQEYLVIGVMCRLLVNSLTLMSETRDPLGLSLDPTVARVNHACDYNSIIQFSRSGELSIFPLQKIEAGTEITIGYIDCTMPFRRRQIELRERYFFDCTCTLCQQNISGWLDKMCSLPSGVSSPNLDNSMLAIEQRAVALIDSANKDSSISGPINKLRYGLHILHHTGIWPLHRYPYSTIRQDLVLAYLKAKQYHLCLIQVLTQYLRIDPKLMPKHHPVRIVHGCLLVELIDHIRDAKEWAIQKNDVAGKLELGLLMCDVLNDLYKLQQKLHPDQPLSRIIRWRHSLVKRSLWRDWESKEKAELNHEWSRADELVNEALKGETEWKED